MPPSGSDPSSGIIIPEPRSTSFAMLVAVSMAIATVFADWVTVSVQIPLGVLLLLFVLILLPTGDVIRLWAVWIDSYTKSKQTGPPHEQTVEHEQQAKKR